MDLTLLALLLLALLFVVLAAGIWIGIGLGLVGAIAIGVASPAPVGQVAVTAIWGDSAEWTLTALPMFLWMGEILFRTRISESMFKGLAPWLTGIPGRLLHVNVLGCALFGSISGSSTATCATISQIALPELKKRGYPESITLGSLASAGTLGILIPPSIIMIVYAVAAEVSIIKLFVAGILPGLLVVVLFSAYIVIWALLHPDQIPQEVRLSLRERIRASKELLPTLVLVAGVITGLFSGVATATEIGALGVAAALALAALTGSLTRKSFVDSAYGALRTTCMIGLILAGSSVLSAAMAFTGIPRGLSTWVAGMQLSPFLLIAALCVVYLLLGTALEGVAMILLTTSITLPLVTAAGFDPIWFGIFIVLMTELSTLTPPVGFNLFVLHVMSGRDSNYIARSTLPFFLLLILTVAILAVFPEIVTWLPKQLTPR
ncbi:MAG: TRAP transporter large permease [Burkholderiales bacterium]